VGLLPLYLRERGWDEGGFFDFGKPDALANSMIPARENSYIIKTIRIFSNIKFRCRYFSVSGRK
jgi:hypothetical protein